jgi:hypothetical protein
MARGTEQAKREFVYLAYVFSPLGIILAWASAVIALIIVGLSTWFLPVSTRTDLEGSKLYLRSLFWLPTTIGFAAALALIHGSVSLSILPHKVRWKWAFISFVAGAGYWIMLLVMRGYILGEEGLGLVTMMQRAENGSAAETLSLLYIAGVGALIGMASGMALGVVQWALLRRYVTQAHHWIVATTISSTIIYTLITWCGYWFTGGDSWN